MKQITADTSCRICISGHHVARELKRIHISDVNLEEVECRVVVECENGEPNIRQLSEMHVLLHFP